MIIISTLVVMMMVSNAFADDSRDLKDNKQELDQIKQKLDETEKKVDSLKQIESSLKKAISNYGERVNRNRKLVGRLENQLKSAQSDLTANNDLLDHTQMPCRDYPA